jgi:hypothetical protein
MSTENPTPTAPDAPSDEQIMCYISKKMVPMSETVEVQYSPGRKYRVLARYIRYA